MRQTEIKYITQQLIRFAIPLSISGFVVALAALINTKIIGKNIADLYVFSIFAPIYFFMIAFQESFRAAAIMIAANHRLLTNIKTTLLILLLITLVVGLIFSICLNEFTDQLTALLHVDKLFVDKFQHFCKQITIINLSFISVIVVLNAFILGLGYKKAGLIFSVSSNAITSFILYWQIVYLKMDINALSTAFKLSGIFIFSAMIYFLSKQTIWIQKYQRPSKNDFVIIVNALKKISCPLFLSYIIIFGGLIAFNHILSAYGADVLSGYYISYRLQTFIILPAISIGSAMAILMSNEMINKSKHLLWLVVVTGSSLSIIFYEGVGQLLYYFRDYFVNLIVLSPVIKQSAIFYLKYVAKTFGLLGPVLVLLTLLEQRGYGYLALTYNIFYFLIIFFIGKKLVETHHPYTSFYQVICSANIISGFIAFGFIILFRRKLIHSI